jgi:FAD/FMN-containing dehydrogenase
MLRIRCQKCGQHTEKIVTVLVRKDAISCGNCGARISLSTPTNKILIAETAASCDRIGEALLAVHAEDLDCVIEPGVTRKQLNEHLRDHSRSSRRDPGTSG